MNLRFFNKYMMFLSKILIYRKDLYIFNTKLVKKTAFFDVNQKNPILKFKNDKEFEIDSFSSYVNYVENENELIILHQRAIQNGFPCIYIMDNNVRLAILIGPAEEEALKINNLINL